MYIISWVSWLFVASLGAVNAAASGSSGVVEVDLVFPRNDTYAPAPYVPIVFGFQNTELATLLNLNVKFQVWNITNGSIFDPGSFGYYHHYLKWTNTSTDPAFEYRHYDQLNTEGIWALVWTVYWSNCTEMPYSEGSSLTSHVQSSRIVFTTKKSAQDIDLVAATKDENCSEDQGIAYNITDTGVNFDTDEQCAIVANYTVTPNPCRVKIDSATASNISASLPEQMCSVRNSPIECPSEKSAAQRLLAGGMTCLMTGFGGLSYLLM